MQSEQHITVMCVKYYPKQATSTIVGTALMKNINPLSVKLALSATLLYRVLIYELQSHVF
jgi:hypothetical protein